MTKDQRVLVVVDPTASFHPALERAVWIARHAPARLELFICDYDAHLANTRGAPAASLAEAQAQLIARHRQRLEQLAAPLRESGLTVSVDARWDYPIHDAIVRKAVDFGADIVVKDTHFHDVLRRSIFSNTDWSLTRNCPATLWLVKPRPPGKKPCFVAAVDPLHERDKPAELDNKILSTASSLATSLGGELHVFHAFDISAALAVSTDSMTMPISLPVHEITDAMRTEHTAAVDALCERHGIPKERRHVHQGGTRDLLMTLTEQLRADVVVMGAVSRSGLKALFLGNTAEDVLDRLHCDLLIVKPEGFKVVLPS